MLPSSTSAALLTRLPYCLGLLRLSIGKYGYMACSQSRLPLVLMETDNYIYHFSGSCDGGRCFFLKF
ncbi:hypothetical protein BDD12DRAFT_838604 [Trichophaea hybrida]|nr:hypothetical protein BDD12DRAFT_838604 [Trichophaea hybrida]